MKTMSNQLLIFLLLLVGCSTTRHEILNKQIAYTKFIIDRDQNLSKQRQFVYYRVGNKLSCFENTKDTDEIITASPEDIKFVFNYLYRNFGTLTLKKESIDYGRQVRVVAEENAKIHYEMAFCRDEWLGVFHTQDIDLVSYRILKKETLESEK